MIRLWVNDINTTSLRIIVSIALAAVMVLMLLVGVTIRNWYPTDMQLKVIYAAGGGLLMMMGFDVTQFAAKRFSDAAYVQAKQGPAAVSIEPPSNVTVTQDGATTTIAAEPTPTPQPEPIVAPAPTPEAGRVTTKLAGEE